MASTCTVSHEALTATQHWKVLLGLKRRLQESQEKNRPQNSGFPVLGEDVVQSLATFELPIPTSDRMLQNVLSVIEKEKTIAILYAVVITFPCKLCRDSLYYDLPTLEGVQRQDAKNIDTTVRFSLDSLGKHVGEWKVLLSSLALKSLRALGNSGTLQ